LVRGKLAVVRELGYPDGMRYSFSGGDFSMTTLQEAIVEENRRIRLLRIVSDLLIQLLMSGRVSVSEADSLIDGVKDLAMRLFPGKELAFDLIYVPRFRRALLESGAYEDGPALKILDGGKRICEDSGNRN
jgi:hypothetical protein